MAALLCLVSLMHIATSVFLDPGSVMQVWMEMRKMIQSLLKCEDWMGFIRWIRSLKKLMKQELPV